MSSSSSSSSSSAPSAPPAPRTWYMQLSQKNFDQLTKTEMKDRFPGNLVYELGNARITMIPEVGDCVIVLGKKHKVTVGFILDTYDCPEKGKMYVVYLEKISPEYNGIFFRRNWTLVK